MAIDEVGVIADLGGVREGLLGVVRADPAIGGNPQNGGFLLPG